MQKRFISTPNAVTSVLHWAIEMMFPSAGILKNQRRGGVVEDAIDVEMQCDMLFILSVLTDGDIHRKVTMAHRVCFNIG